MVCILYKEFGHFLGPTMFLAIRLVHIVEVEV